MKKLKSGFTLSEVLVTLGVIGVLLGILMPVMKNAMPNQSMVMFKKSYYIIERVVSELVNDDDMYPDVIDDDVEPFLGNIMEITYNGKEYQGDTKFCELFSEKLNLKSEATCVEKTFTDGELPDAQFVTTDNVAYILPIDSFEDEAKANNIYIDVNGDKAPNCFYNDSTCTKPDRFTVKIYQSGRILVDGKREKQYLSSSDITKTAEDYDK